jgi:hypothetical protein
LDNAKPASSGTAAVQAEDENGFENEEETEAVATFGLAHSRLLDELDDGLLALAEAGLAGSSPLRVERIRQAIPRTERMGLHGLKIGLSNFINRPHPHVVLCCAWLSQLHRRAMPNSFTH